MNKISLKTQVLGIVFASVAAVLMAAGVGYSLSNPVTQEDTSVSEDMNICGNEVKACGDGTILIKNPNNNCQFDACPAPVPAENNTRENNCCNQSDWYACETETEYVEGELACGQNSCAVCEAN